LALTRVLTGDAARRLIGRSLEPSLRAIAASLGPFDRACLYDGNGGPIGQAHTGAAIARATTGDEGPWNIAPRILRETLFDAERDFGDGTARLAIIMNAAFSAGLKFVAAGISPGRIADCLLALTPQIIDELSRERLADLDLAAVAKSAGANAGLAAEIVAACMATGKGGLVEIVKGTRAGMETRLGTGFILDCLAVSDAFAPAGSDDISFDPIHILVADGMIDDSGPLVPILEGFATRGKALAIIARDVTGSALATLIANKRDNHLRIAALKPQAVAEQAADILEDLAIATGATLIAERFGTSVAGLRPSHLGRAERFLLRRNRAIFSQAAGDPTAIALRARLLEATAERAKYLSLDRERLVRRRARLQGQWGEIELAGVSERETENLLVCARAAVAAIRSAEASGAIAGGGIALERVAARLACHRSQASITPEDAALDCAIAGLKEVSRQLTRNAGNPVQEGGNAATRASPPCPDPLLLTQAIVQRALSLAATLLRVDTFICT
jgi:chaperonin GroEL